MGLVAPFLLCAVSGVRAGDGAPAGAPPGFERVCLSAEEADLLRLIDSYRAENGLPPIPRSRSLTAVAQLHTRDLARHGPNRGTDSRGQRCNLHSWSANGPWTAVCYTPDHFYDEEMWKKPREITRNAYRWNGYENAYRGANPRDVVAQAYRIMTSHAPHDDVILERGIWEGKHWPALGVGIQEGFATVWFGDGKDPLGSVEACGREQGTLEQWGIAPAESEKMR